MDRVLSFGKPAEKSLTQIYEENCRGFACCAFRVLHDKAAADDVVQQAYINVLEALGEYPSEKMNIRAYLYKTVYNLAVDEVRRRRKIRLYIEERGGEQQTESFVEWLDPSGDIVMDSFRVDCLRRCLRLLENDMQLMIYYKYCKNLCSREIAKIMGLTESCVNTRMFRARATLRKKMEVRPDG